MTAGQAFGRDLLLRAGTDRPAWPAPRDRPDRTGPQRRRAARRAPAPARGTLTIRTCGRLVRHSSAITWAASGDANPGFASRGRNERFGAIAADRTWPPVRFRSMTTSICRRGSTPRRSGSATVPCSAGSQRIVSAEANCPIAAAGSRSCWRSAWARPSVMANSVDCSGMLSFSDMRLPA